MTRKASTSAIITRWAEISSNQSTKMMKMATMAMEQTERAKSKTPCWQKSEESRRTVTSNNQSLFSTNEELKKK